MLLLVVGRLEEDRGDLLVSFLLRYGRKIGVLVARLRLARKRGHQVLFGLAAFEFHIRFLPVF